MSSRKSPSGPASSFTGFVVLAQTAIAAGSLGPAATATGFAQIFVGPQGTATALMNPAKMTTNDIVSLSPRGTVPLSTSTVVLSYARVLSVGTASAIIEVTLGNTGTAAATAVANTWNINVDLMSSDL